MPFYLGDFERKRLPQHELRVRLTGGPCAWLLRGEEKSLYRHQGRRDLRNGCVEIRARLPGRVTERPLTETKYSFVTENDMRRLRMRASLQGNVACMRMRNEVGLPSMTRTTSFPLATSLQLRPCESRRLSSMFSCSRRRFTISALPSEAARCKGVVPEPG